VRELGYRRGIYELQIYVMGNPDPDNNLDVCSTYVGSLSIQKGNFDEKNKLNQLM
jgi:hypothetical protein